MVKKSSSIEKVAVLGAGVMGAQIAAQVANAGIPVLLLDIVPDGADHPNVLAQGAVDKMLKTKPAPFMHKRNAKLIEVGNLRDDLGKLAECDWIIEAVIERLDIKHKVYADIDAHRKKESIVSSNTSTIPLDQLTEGQSDAFKQNFLITHFFNPPRYMRLLELVVSPHTHKESISQVSNFCDRMLGKTVVNCHDSPGFIANRIGTYWIQRGLNEAVARGISPEEADTMLSRPMGVPKTGVFGLMDLVGIDLMPHLAKSLTDTLPKGDPYVTEHVMHDFVTKMINDGYTGRKGKGGFYRLNDKRKKEVRDLKTGEYTLATKPKLEAANAGKKGLRAVMEHDSDHGQYAWAVMSASLHYAANLLGEVADDILSIDQAMQLGFNWKKGPFELMQELGAQWLVDQWSEQGLDIPPIVKRAAEGEGFYRTESGRLEILGLDGAYSRVMRPEGVLLLADIKRANEPIAKNGSASIWHIGDGVLCFEFHTKMNAIDQDLLGLYSKAISLIGDGQGDYKALVIYNEGSHFSAGANLGLALFALNIALYDQIDDLVATGQNAYKSLKYAPFPVVGAPSGLALGGGCEILLHCDAVVAHAETYVGLVEVGVGIIPGWGGCKEMLFRHAQAAAANLSGSTGWRPSTMSGAAGGPMVPASKAFETIATAKTATSAAEAFDLLYLRKGVDDVVMNRDRVLFEAKEKALELAKEYQAPDEETQKVLLPGEGGRLAVESTVDGFHASGKATDYDVVVSKSLARVLCGGGTDIVDPVSEQRLLDLERDEFMKLVRNDGTLARMEHMLNTGKPLRN